MVILMEMEIVKDSFVIMHHPTKYRKISAIASSYLLAMTVWRLLRGG